MTIKWDDINTNHTASNNSHTLSNTTGSWYTSESRSGMKTSGKWYWEINVGAVGSGVLVGLSPVRWVSTSPTIIPGSSGAGLSFQNDGTYYVNGATDNSHSAFTFTTAGVVQVALDLDNGYLWVGADGTWAKGDPDILSSASITGITWDHVWPAVSMTGTCNTTLITTKDRFTHDVPDGFLPLGHPQPVAAPKLDLYDSRYTLLGAGGRSIMSTYTAWYTAEASKRVLTASDRVYYEVLIMDPTDNMVGFTSETLYTGSYYPGQTTGSWGYYCLNGNKYNNASATAFGSSAATAGDIVGLLLYDGAFYVSVNGTWQGGADGGSPTGTAAVFTGLSSVWPVVGSHDIADAVICAFTPEDMFSDLKHVPSDVELGLRDNSVSKLTYPTAGDPIAHWTMQNLNTSFYLQDEMGTYHASEPISSTRSEIAHDSQLGRYWNTYASGDGEVNLATPCPYRSISVFAKRAVAGDLEYHAIWTTASGPVIRIEDGPYLSLVGTQLHPTMAIEEWVHYVIVKDGAEVANKANLRLFVNGVDYGVFSNSVYDTANIVTFGNSYNHVDHANADMANFMAFDYDLTQADVLEIRDLQLPTDETLWTPSEITTELWLDASDPSTISIDHTSLGVEQWDDKSGNDRHFAQSTDSQQPDMSHSRLNRRDTLSFDDTVSNNLTNSDAFSSAEEFNLFVVIKANTDPPATSGASGSWDFNGTSNSSNSHFPFTDGVIYESFATDTRRTLGNPTRSLTQFNIYSVHSRVDGYSAYINGVELYSDNNSNTPNIATTVSIGLSSGAGTYFDGVIAELIIVAGPVDRVKMEGYLAHKWNLTKWLPETHKHKYNAPEVYQGPLLATISSGTTTTDLTQFPATLMLNDGSGTTGLDARNIFSTLRDDWKYLNITDSNGVSRYFEVDYWNSAANQAVLHVDTDISSTQDTVLTLSYDPEEIISGTLDDFIGTNGDSPNPNKWKPIAVSNSPSAYTCEIQDDELDLAITVGSTTNANLYVYSRYDLPDEYSIEVPFSALSMSADSSLLIGFHLSDDRFAGFGRNPIGGQCFWSRLDSGADHSLALTNTYGGLRIVRNGMLLTAYGKDGTGAWTVIQSVTDYVPTNESFRIYVYAADLGRSISATMGAITVNYSEPFSGIDSTVDKEHLVSDSFTGSDGDPPDPHLWEPILSTGTQFDPQIISNKLNFASSDDSSNDIAYLRYRRMLGGDFSIQLKFELVTYVGANSVDIIIESENYYIYLLRRCYQSGGLNQYSIEVFNKSWTPLVSQQVTYTNSVGGLKIVYDDTAEDVTFYVWDESQAQWEWNNNTAGYTYTLSGPLNMYYIQTEAVRHGATNSGDFEVNFTEFTVNYADTVYGVAGATGSYPAQQVWDRSYRGVYHMGQDPSGTAPQLIDSTRYNHDGTSAGTMTEYDLEVLSDGTVMVFDGTNDHFTLGDLGIASGDFTGTIETRVSFDDASGDICVVGLGTSAIRQSFTLFSTSSTFVSAYASSNNYTSSGDSLVSTTWSNLAVTKAAGTIDAGTTLYWDGAVQAGSGPTETPNFTYTNSAIGVYTDLATYPMEGKVSEIRVSNVERSSDWMSASSLGLLDSLFTLSYIPVADLTNEYIFTIASYDITSELIDFPGTLVISNNCGKTGVDIGVLTSFDWKYLKIKDSSGTQLYAEFEQWDSVNEVGVVHVKIPTVSPISDTVITIDSSWTDWTNVTASDSFTGSNGDFLDSTKWSSLSVGSTVGSYTAEIQDNGFDFGVTGNTVDNNAAIESSALTVIGGDFDIQISFSDLTVSGGAGIVGMVLTDPGGFHTNTFVAVGYNSANQFWFRLNGSDTTAARTNDYGGLKYVRTGSNLSLQYKDGTGSWTELTSDASFGTDDIQIKLWTYVYQASASVLATMDDFVINSADNIYHYGYDYRYRTNEDASDDFTSSVLVDTNKWRVVNDTASGTVSIVSDKLRIAIPSTANDESISIFSKFLVTGRFDIRVSYDVVSYDAPSSSTTYLCQLVLYDTAGNYLQVAATSDSGSTRMVSGASNVSESNYSPHEDPGILRLEYDGTTIKAYVYDGTQWEWGGSTAGRDMSATTFDPSLGFVVKVLVLGDFDSGVTTDIDYIRLEKADSITGFNGEPGDFAARQVWDDNFVAVYHMSQDPSGTAPQILDSTMNHDGTSYGTMLSTDLVNGTIGKAIAFDGTDDIIKVDDSSSFQVTNLTIEAVFDLSVTGTVAGYRPQGAYTDGRGYFLNGSSFQKGSADGTWEQVSTTLPTGTSYFAGIYPNDSSDMELFVDGVSDGTTTPDTAGISYITTGGTSEGTYFLIGSNTDNSGVVSGAATGNIGEVRVSNVVRSDGWIKTTNLSLTDDLFTITGDFLDIPPDVFINALFRQGYGFMDFYAGILEQPYLLTGTPFYVALQQYYHLRMYVKLTQPYDDVPVIWSKLDQYYWSALYLLRTLRQEYGDSEELYASLAQYYSGPELVVAQLLQRYFIINDALHSPLEQPYDLNDLNVLLRQLRQTYALDSDSSIQKPLSSVLINGTEVQTLSVSVEYSLSQYVGSCSLVLATYAEWSAVEHLDPILVTINAQEYNFIVTDLKRTDTATSSTFVIEGLSQAVLLDFPYASEIVDDDSENPIVNGYASDVCSTLAALEGQTIVWELPVDPPQSPTTYQVDGESPLTAIRNLVNELGGKLQSYPDGSLKAVRAYKVNSNQYDTAAIDFTFTSSLSFTSLSADHDKRNGYNKFSVSNETTASTTQLEAEQVSPGHYKIKAPKVPWDSSPMSLRTSELTNVTILGPVETVEVIEDEVVEIVSGEGQTEHSVYALTDIDYGSRINLGNITFSESGVITTSDVAETLLTLSYETKYWLWNVYGTDSEDVQFILE